MALAGAVLLAACGSAGGGSSSNPSKDDLAIEPASYDLAVGWAGASADAG